MLKLLIRGGPAILKPYLVAKQDEIKRDAEYNKSQGNNVPKQLSTWVELMHCMVRYSQETVWENAPAEKQNLKPWGEDVKVRPVKQGTETRSKANKF